MGVLLEKGMKLTTETVASENGQMLTRSTIASTIVEFLR